MKDFSELNKHFNEEIEIQGFVDKIRDLPYVQFLILRNANDKLQITIEKNEENKKLNDIVSSLTIDSTLKVNGKLLENTAVKLGGMELIPSSIEITSLALENKPIDYKDKSNALRETRLDYRFLDLRREDNKLLFQVQTYIEFKMFEYWLNNGYTMLHTPKISAAAAEGGAALFKLDYFGTPAVLSQSPQLYKQMCMASGFNKFCEISQVYRAENSHTSYHQTEIEMIDMEISWVNSVHDVCDEQEAWIRYFMTALKEKYGEEIKKTFNVEVSDVSMKFPRITFTEAKQLLKDKYNYVGEVAEDFERKEEELIGQYAKEKYKSDFIFVVEYPYSSRPFYTMKAENGMTRSFDLLYKGLEITSGAQREHRYEILCEQIKEKKIPLETLAFYTEFFKYGCPPHGGLGLGMARLMMLLLNIDNIRESTLIYRGPTRINP
jgi:aspartyl-tRNA synthetase